jgi:translation initiation factor IF-2
MVTEGYIRRNSIIRLLRAGVLIHEGKMKTLKRFKDDANEVKTGFECGLLLDGFNDLQIGDIIEVSERRETSRSLDDVMRKDKGE